MINGAIIKNARKSRNLTQAELAEILGVKQTTVCEWENSNNSPKFDVLFRLSKVLGVNVSELGNNSDTDESK